MIAKVRECIYPESVNCRGCSHSYNPALYDGGCKLHYETGGGAKSLEAQKLETAAQPDTKNRKIDKGGGY